METDLQGGNRRPRGWTKHMRVSSVVFTIHRSLLKVAVVHNLNEVVQYDCFPA